MTREAQPKLAKCPFCGRGPLIGSSEFYPPGCGWKVECCVTDSLCEHDACVHAPTKRSAIEQWNQRISIKPKRRRARKGRAK